MKKHILHVVLTFAAALAVAASCVKPIEVIKVIYEYDVRVDDIHVGDSRPGECLIMVTEGGANGEAIAVQYLIDNDPRLQAVYEGLPFASGDTVILDGNRSARFTLPDLNEGRHRIHLNLTNKYGRAAAVDTDFSVVRDKVPVESVTAPLSVTLDKGSSEDLSVVLAPGDADNLTIAVTSADPSVAVAEVSGEGAWKTVRVTGTGVGQTALLITNEDIPGVAAKVDVTVFEYVFPGLSDMQMEAGSMEVLSLTVTPMAAINLDSSDASVVSVSRAGGNIFTLTAHRQGVAVLTASVGATVRTCVVTVTPPPVSVSVSPGSATIAQNGRRTFTVSSTTAWTAVISGDGTYIDERGDVYVVVANDNATYEDKTSVLTVYSDDDASVYARAEITAKGRPETVTLIVASQSQGQTSVSVLGDNGGWYVANRPAGLRMETDAGTVTLYNDTSSDIEGLLTVRTAAQRVEASISVKVLAM